MFLYPPRRLASQTEAGFSRTSAFNPLLSVVLFEVNEEMLVLHRYTVEKWRGILTTVPNHSGYHSSEFHQNSTGGLFSNRVMAMWPMKPPQQLFILLR